MRQTIFSDSNLTLFQSAINDQFSQLAQIPFINGVLLEDVSLTSGANTINHGLNKVPTGFFVFSNTANTVIWNDTFSSSVNMVLRCSTNATVTLWVF